ncbi:MAG TPA: amidohydrolase family protein [Bryobacteraceae bacterium]|nr:amidohydrolase family protein [Bryobacteraceae bacterium]
MKAALLFAIPAALIAAPGADDSFVLKNATVHTMAGAEIQNGSVVVRNGKIIGVGKNLSVPKDLKVIDAKGMQVYPGMIDAATQVGLIEINSIRESEDTTELGKFNPQLVALTAVNPSSEHIPVTRVNGITTVAATPEGSLIGGQVSLVHLDGWTTDEMGIKPHAGLQLRFPTIALPGGRGGGIDADPSSPFAAARSYTTLKQAYDKEIAELNEFFESAHRYKLTKDAKAPGFKPDLRLDAMIPVIEGKEPVLVEARRERDIRDAIAFADKQKIKIILLDPAEAYKVTKEIKDHNIPVILGPSLALPLTEDGNYDQAYKTPLALQKAGIEFCFATLTGGSNLASRNLPYQAGQAVAFGLSKEDAMKAVTKNAADIWGVGDQIGTVEEGKWADLVVTDGDPLEAQTQIKLLFIKGKPVDLDNKQKDLYEKYLNRP